MALIKANRPPDWSLNGRIIGKQLLLSAYPPSQAPDRKSTRLNSSHTVNSYAVFCLKKKNAYQRGASDHPNTRTLAQKLGCIISMRSEGCPERVTKVHREDHNMLSKPCYVNRSRPSNAYLSTITHSPS